MYLYCHYFEICISNYFVGWCNNLISYSSCKRINKYGTVTLDAYVASKKCTFIRFVAVLRIYLISNKWQEVFTLVWFWLNRQVLSLMPLNWKTRPHWNITKEESHSIHAVVKCACVKAPNLHERKFARNIINLSRQCIVSSSTSVLRGMHS